MSKPVSRGMPSVRPPSPITMSRSARSFMSTTRFQLARRASMPQAVSWWSALSTSAASRLCALETAWKSPVKCMLMSSTGTTSEAPPPAPPPFAAPLHADRGPEARLAQRDGPHDPDLREPLREPDAGGGLPLARGGRGDGRHQHQLAPAGTRAERLQCELGLPVAVLLHVRRIQAQRLGDLQDGSHEHAL